MGKCPSASLVSGKDVAGPRCVLKLDCVPSGNSLYSMQSDPFQRKTERWVFLPVPSSLSTGVIAMAFLTPFRKCLFAKVLWDSGMQTPLAIRDRDPGACPHVATAKAEAPAGGCWQLGFIFGAGRRVKVEEVSLQPLWSVGRIQAAPSPVLN